MQLVIFVRGGGEGGGRSRWGNTSRDDEHKLREVKRGRNEVEVDNMNHRSKLRFINNQINKSINIISPTFYGLDGITYVKYLN